MVLAVNVKVCPEQTGPVFPATGVEGMEIVIVCVAVSAQGVFLLTIWVTVYVPVAV